MVGPKHHRETAMDYYAGIDVSLEQSSVCVMDATGKIVCEAKVASEPEALVRFFGHLGVRVTRIGLEAGPLSQWLHAGLSEAGLETPSPQLPLPVVLGGWLPSIRLSAVKQDA